MSLKMVFEKLCKRITNDLEPGLNLLEAAKLHADCLIQYEIYNCGKDGLKSQREFSSVFYARKWSDKIPTGGWSLNSSSF